jgi:hypothetical protein
VRTQLVPVTLHGDNTLSNDTSRSLALRLPGRAEVREVASQDLLAYSSWSVSEGQTLLELEFGTPLVPGREILLDFTIPLQERDGHVAIPPLPLLGDPGVRSHRIGLRAMRGFLLTASAQAEPVQELPADLFEIPGDRAWPTPEVAYVVKAPSELTAGLERVEPLRAASWQQSLSVREGHVDWRVAATIDVSGTPAYAHRIQIGGDARVESVSLLQDGADRLLNWSRDGEQLLLNVQSEATGKQELKITGRIPLGSEATIEIPSLAIAGAELTSAELIVENGTLSSVEFVSADGAELSERLPAAGASPSGGLPTRRFSMLAGPRPAALRMIAPPEPTPVMQIRSVMPTGGDWQLSHTFAASELPVPLTIRVPRSLVSAVGLDPGIISELTSSAGEDEPSESVDLQVRPTTTGPWNRTTLSIPITAPAGGEWSLPSIVPQGVSDDGSWLILPSDVPIDVDPADAVPVESAPEEVVEAAIPAAADTPRIYQLHSPNPRLILREAATGPFILPLCESIIWLEGSDHVAGVSRWYITAQQRECRVNIQLPGAIRLKRVYWNGEDHAFQEDEPSVSVVSSIVTVGSVHCLEFAWGGAVQTSSWGRTIVDRPIPQEVLPLQDLVTLVPAAEGLRFPRGDAESNTLGEYGLARLEAELSAASLISEEARAGTGMSLLLQDIEATIAELSRRSLTGNEAPRLERAKGELPSVMSSLAVEADPDTSAAPWWDRARSAATLGSAWTQPGGLWLRMPANTARIELWSVSRMVGQTGASVLLLAAGIAGVLRWRRFKLPTSLSPAAGSYAGLVLAGLVWWRGFQRA